MKRSLLVVATLVLYALHQDIWFWRQARPLVLGFLPIGLAYHALYAGAASLLLWLLVSRAWPAHLEQAGEPGVAKPAPSATPTKQVQVPPDRLA